MRFRRNRTSILFHLQFTRNRDPLLVFPIRPVTRSATATVGKGQSRSNGRGRSLDGTHSLEIPGSLLFMCGAADGKEKAVATRANDVIDQAGGSQTRRDVHVGDDSIETAANLAIVGRPHLLDWESCCLWHTAAASGDSENPGTASP